MPRRTTCRKAGDAKTHVSSGSKGIQMLYPFCKPLVEHAASLADVPASSSCGGTDGSPGEVASDLTTITRRQRIKRGPGMGADCGRGSNGLKSRQ